MSEDFKEKLRSVGFAHRHRGKTREWIVRSERDGSPAGRQIEHWDGRVDAQVTPATTKTALRRKED